MMCSWGERRELDIIFNKYKVERKIDEEDIKALERLVRSAQIEYVYKDDGKAYARASETGQILIDASGSITNS